MAGVVRQAIVFGDGGLDSANPLMDLYVVANARKKNPTVCFLPTASGDNQFAIEMFKRLFSNYYCQPTVLTLSNPHTKDIEDFVMSADVIYVGGGHTKSMLSVWKECGLDKFLKQAYDNGTLLSGGSAGSVCWFDECITDSIPGALTVMPCLGILPFSNCPHFLSQERRAAYAKAITNRSIKPGYASDDFSGIHFQNEELVNAIASNHFSKSYYLSFDGECQRKQLPTKWIDLHQDELVWSKLEA